MKHLSDYQKRGMNIFQIIKNAVAESPREDPVRTAKKILASIKRVELLDLIVREVEHCQRLFHRGSEMDAYETFAEAFTKGEPLKVPSNLFGGDISQPFAALLESPIKLGDGSTVTWGIASVVQLRQRLAMLVKYRDALDTDILMLSGAIARLEETGAKNLNELAEMAA